MSNQGGISMLSLDQRLAVLENAVNTIPTAIMNVVLEILTELDSIEGIDKAGLKSRLEGLRDIHIENGNKKAYNDLIDLALTRLS